MSTTKPLCWKRAAGPQNKEAHICILLVSLLASPSLAAETANVVFKGWDHVGATETDKFSFDPISTDLFGGFKNIMPGDTRKQNITVTNEDDEAVEIFLRAEPIHNLDEEIEEEWIKFLNILHLKVTNKRDVDNPAVIFEEQADKQDGLAPGQSGLGVSLGEFPAGSTITLTAELTAPLEEMNNDYQRKYGEIVWIFAAKTIEVPGDLIISKTVAGDLADTDKEWTFTLSLDAEGSFPYVRSDGTNGEIADKGQIKLKHGQSVTISNIPIGTSYEVTEAEANTGGYITNSSGTIGEITEEVSRVTFTNTRESGKLRIIKNIQGDLAEADKEWTFRVSFSDGGSYPYTGSKEGTIPHLGVITLKGGESVTISELPIGLEYEVFELEANTNGYTTISSGTIGLISKTISSAVFTNSKNTPPRGALVLQKRVSGDLADTDREWHFTVTFSDGGTYHYTGSKEGDIKSGEQITLKHNESVHISGIPVGVNYTVTEAESNADGYTTTSSGTIGTITQTVSTAAFINSKGTPPTGELVIRKTVSGDASDVNREWHFTVTFSDGGTYPYNGSKIGSIKSGEQITLKHSESVRISGIPISVTYTVIEAEANQSGYTTTATGTIGAITQTVSTAAFVNSKDNPPTGELVIRKTVSGNASDTNREWHFTVTFSDGGTYPYNGSKTGSIKSGEQITLKHSESVRISGIPIGVTYTVIEAEANQSGYTTTATGTQGTISGVASVAAFLNDKSTGELILKKTVAGSAADTDREWHFTLTFSEAGSFPYSGSKTGVVKSGDTIVLRHSESVRITDLPLGMTYSIVETEANADGYTTTSSGARGVISQTISTAEFINSKSTPPTGELIIIKTVSGTGGDANREWHFTVTFSDGGAYPYTGSKTGVVKSGEQITLKHTESVRISGIPLGVTYTVTEAEANEDGYVTTMTGESGTITEAVSTAVFNNAKDSPPDSPPTGDRMSYLFGMLAAVTGIMAVSLKRRKAR